MTDTDPTITIAGHEARIEALSEALHDAHRAFADVSTSARKMDALNAAVTAERDALATQLNEARAELSRRAADGDALALRADLASARAALYRSQRDEAEIRGALAKVADAIGCGHSADAVAEAIGKLAARASAAEAEAARLTAAYDQARVDDQQSLATWLRLLKAVDPKVENTDDALRVLNQLKGRVAELEARPVLTEERLCDIIPMSIAATKGWTVTKPSEVAQDMLRRLGPVTLPLPAQDRAEDLCNAYIDKFHRKDGHHVVYDAASQDERYDAMRRALASLGAPATTPAAAIDADALLARCEADFMGGYTGQMYDAFKHGMWTVCNVLRSCRTPAHAPAPADVFAGVSEYDLGETIRVAYADGERGKSFWTDIARAVLARLRVTLVAPADPEAVAKRTINGSPTDGQIGRCRDALTAAGIPVTPERGQ